jgi:hypothetical protein
VPFAIESIATESGQIPYGDVVGFDASPVNPKVLEPGDRTSGFDDYSRRFAIAASKRPAVGMPDAVPAQHVPSSDGGDGTIRLPIIPESGHVFVALPRLEQPELSGKIKEPAGGSIVAKIALVLITESSATKAEEFVG